MQRPTCLLVVPVTQYHAGATPLAWTYVRQAPGSLVGFLLHAFPAQYTCVHVVPS